MPGVYTFQDQDKANGLLFIVHYSIRNERKRDENERRETDSGTYKARRENA